MAAQTVRVFYLYFMNEKFAVLYSFEQKAFHIETLGEYIQSNITVTCIKKDHQYRLIGLFNTYDEGSEFVKTIRSKYNW